MEKTSNSKYAHRSDDRKPFNGDRKPFNNDRKSRDFKPFNKPNRSESKPEPKNKQQLVCGIRPVIEAIDSGAQIDRLLIQTGLASPLLSELKAILHEANIPFQYVPVEKLDRLTHGNHQGVVATIAPIQFHSFLEYLPVLQLRNDNPFVILLDHITDVRNMGAIVRTAECAGVQAVVIPDHGSAQISEDAIKTSSGALLRVPICREPNLKTVINFAKQSGMQVVAATEKASQSYLTIDYTKPTLLIMGSEDTGISNELLKLADYRAALPIRGEVQSLNVSVAAAIFMYEALRQREGSAEE